MNRHIKRGAAGFSFVELLVTIIIAAIAFAAIVPVFVAASKKGAGDSARNVALNLAQDRIEKIRELDYDLITEGYLQSTSFQGGAFGTTADVPNGGGTKTYTVDYSVTFVGGSKDGQPVETTASGDGSEQYKLVSVDVYWTGNPKPVKHAVLQTIVYKQYTGSYVDSLVVSPIDQHGSPPRDFVNDYTITLTAKVNAADITNTKSVVFKVYGANGVQLKRLVRYWTDTDYGGGADFTQTYTILDTSGPIATNGSRDGTYTFKATAINKNGYEGNTQTVTLPVETGNPPRPTGLVAVATSSTVDLTWAMASAGDVTSYRVYRRTSSTSYGSYETVTVTTGQVPTFKDVGLTNETTYYYQVVAVDSLDRPSLLALSEVSSKPVASSDTTRPSYVAGFLVTPTGAQAPPLKLRLTWTMATDNVGVAKYYVYRKLSTDAAFASTPTYTILADDIACKDIPSVGAYTYDDSSGLGPQLTYNYQIVAVDVAGNMSLTPAPGTGTTLNYQYCKVTAQNNNTKTGAYLKVTNPDGSAIDMWTGLLPSSYTNPTSPTPVNTNGSLYWYLPVGFGFKAGWELDGATTYTFKPIPSSGVILNTAPLTVSFP